MKKNIFIEAGCALIILLFTYTLLNKIIAFNKFYYQLKSSPIIGSYAGIVAVILPVSESAIVALLLYNKTRLTGLYFTLYILILFTAYILYGMFVGKNLPCSCGGVLEGLTWGQHLWFNAVFIVLSAGAIWNMKYGKEGNIRC